MDDNNRAKAHAALSMPKLEYVIEQPTVNISDKKSGYIQVPQQQESGDFYEEVNRNQSRTKEKLFKLIKYNPFVPLGALLTVGVLANGVLAMRRKDQVKSQLMMRYRVLAQGSTIIVLVLGTMLTPYFSKKSENE